MTADKEQEMMIVLAPLIAILMALTATHPDRQALLQAYDAAAQGLREALATWPSAALQQLTQKLNAARAIVTSGANSPASTLM